MTSTVGVYDENVVNANAVDYVAFGSSFTASEFATDVAAAWQQNAGGVADSNGLGFFYEFGASANKQLRLKVVENTNYGLGGGAAISGTSAFSTSFGSYDYSSFSFESISTLANEPLDERVTRFGLTVLSDELNNFARDYGTVTVTGRLASGGTVTASRVINARRNLGDTFYGLAAPTGDSFIGFSVGYAGSPDATPQALRFDDIGFITSAFIEPPPPSLGVSIASGILSEAGGSTIGTVTRTGDLSQPLVVSLTSSDPTQAIVPPSVTILAGQASATFAVNAVNDTFFDGAIPVTITANAAGPDGPVGLDPTFGTAGIASTVLPGSQSVVAVQPDGKIVTVTAAGQGGWVLRRFNSDGTLDSNFGSGGSVTTVLSSFGEYPTPTDIIILPTGKILVGGRFGAGTGSGLIARYTASGSLDSTFASSGIYFLASNWVNDLDLLPDGQIMAAMGDNGTVYFNAIRRTADGQHAGFVMPQSGIGGNASAIEVTADGGFLLAGRETVAKFNATGNLVTTFGVQGAQTFDFGTMGDVIGLDSLDDGRIVVGLALADRVTSGFSTTVPNTYDFAVVRLTADGALDPTFGENGLARIDLFGLDDFATSMDLLPDGRIVLAGRTETAEGVYDQAIVRLNADGRPDVTFGPGGVLIHSLVEDPAEFHDAAALSPDGHIVSVAGSANSPLNGYRVVRYIAGSIVATAQASVTISDDEASRLTSVVDILVDEDDGNYAVGDLSLREAVKITATDGTITFASGLAGLSITLDSQIDLVRNVTIDGPGSTGITIRGNNNGSRIFQIDAGATVLLKDVTLTGGKTTDSGGAVFNQGTLTVEDATVSGNSGRWGGGIYNTGSLTVRRSSITFNVANSGGYGGGIASTGTLVLVDSTVSDNTAVFSGGGLYNGRGVMHAANSTISGNASREGGGGIDSNGTATLRNVTITGNRAESDGGATFGGGGIDASGGLVTLYNTLVAGNFKGNGTVANDVVGAVAVPSRNNLIGDAATAGGLTHGVNGHIVGVSAASVLESTLSNNGGSTKTHALIAGSAAIDAGSNAEAVGPQGTPLSTDQRGSGFVRTFGTAVDIGAYEWRNLGPTANPDSYTVAENTTLRIEAGTPQVDQASESRDHVFLVSDPSINLLQQEVTTGVSGVLHSIDLYVYSTSEIGSSFRFFVNRGSPWQNDAHEFSQTVTVTEEMIDNWVTIDVSTANFQLAAGEVFTIGTVGSGQVNAYLMASNQNPYAGGRLWKDSAVFSQGNYDLAFRTRVSPGQAGVLANDTDPEGDPLTAQLFSGPTHGTLTLNPDGTFVYTPDASYSGTDSFRYRVSDGVTTSSTALVTIQVTAANDPPVGTLTLSAEPFRFSEDAGAMAAVGTVTRSGSIAEDLILTLANSDPTEVSVPEMVTIPAGQTSATFVISAVDDDFIDGTRTVTISTSIASPAGALELDATFGTGGLASTSLTMHWQPPYAAVAIQQDGKILAAGEDATAGRWRLTRFNTDGTLDTTFGTGGFVVTPFAGSSGAIPRKILVQPDGRILVGGESINGTSAAALVARYHANGTLDTSFDADGVSTVGNTVGWVADMGLRSDGKLWLAIEFNGTVDFKIARLNADGTLDTSYLSAGVWVYSATNARASALFVTPDNGFLVAGDNKVGKYNDRGFEVNSFGAFGVATVNFDDLSSGVAEDAVGVAALPDGKVVVGYHLYNGPGTADFGAVRLNVNGAFDTTFSGDGRAIADFIGLDDYATSMAVQADGKIVLAGFTERADGTEDLALVRLGLDGALDVTFDGDGRFSQSVVAGSAEQFFDIAIRGQELVGLGGWGSDFRLARYTLPDVTLTAQRNVFVYDHHLAITVSDVTLTEGDGSATATMTITRHSDDISQALVVTPWTDDAAGREVLLPVSATIAAGELSVTIPITVVDDLYFDGTRQVFVSATASGYLQNSVEVLIADNDAGPVGEANVLVTAYETNGPISQIREYTTGGTLVRIFEVPQTSDDRMRDLVVDGAGKIWFWEGTFAPVLKSLDPLTGGVTSVSLPSGWSTENNGTYGGIETLNDWVFVTDMQTAQGGEASGLIRYDRTTGTAVRFAEMDGPSKLEFRDVAVGADGYVYGLNEFQEILVYDPATLAFVRKIRPSLGGPPDIRGIDVNAAGDIFAAGWNGRLYKASGVTGAQLAVSAETYLPLTDLQLRDDGTIVAGSRDGEYLVTDTSFATATRFSAPDEGVGRFFVTFAATPPVVNLRPSATVTSVTTAEDTDYSGTVGGSDPESAPLTFAIVSGATHGVVSFNADGSFSYSPVPNYAGTDSFTFTVSDGNTTSYPATVAIQVAAVNDPPVASPFAATIDEDGFIDAQLVATDPDGDTLTFARATVPQFGSGFVSPTGQVRYFPNWNYFGSDSFTYTVTDGTHTVTETITITVNPVNDPAYGDYQLFQTLEDTPVSGQILGLEVEGEPMTFTLEEGPAHGAVVVNPDGTFTYTPDPDFSGRYLFDDSFSSDPRFPYYGSDLFTYRVSDDKGAFTIGKTMIDVTPVDDAPVATGEAYTLAEDTTLTLGATPVTRLVMRSEPDDFVGQGLSYDLSGGAYNFDGRKNADNGARVWITGAQSWDLNFAAPNDAYLAIGEYLGAQRFPFQPAGSPGLSVGGQGRGPNTLTGEFYVYDIVWNADKSDIVSFAAWFKQHSDGDEPALLGTIQYNTTIGTNAGLLANDLDVDGDFLTTILVTGPAHGTLSLGRDGTLSYTPDANYHGIDSFSYRISDGTLTSDVVTVSLTVTPLNDPPAMTASYAFSVRENSPLATAVGTVAATDADGQALSYSIVDGNTLGAFAINTATGAITVADASKLDFETTPQFTLTVRATEPGTGGEFAETSVVVQLTDVVAPQVAKVEYGYGTNRWIDASQLTRIAPWQVKTIRITFTQDVEVDLNDLVVTGTLGTYAASTFSYDEATFAAVWTLATPIEADRITVSLDGDGSSGDTNDGVHTDGEYLSGGDLDRALDVLFGDMNGDGKVNILDSLLCRRQIGADDMWADVNGDGVVNILDSLLIRREIGARLPD